MSKIENDLLTIKPFESDKDKIEQRPLMQQNIIPKFASSVYLVGSSASGKSTLLLNLMLKPQFYGGYFDEVWHFSETAGIDSLAKQLKIPKKNQINNFDQDKLKEILEKQRSKVEKGGEASAPKVCIIFDDCIHDQKFLKSAICKEMSILARHFNVMTFFLSQAFKQIPRPIRLSFNCLYIFAGSASERSQIAEEYTPPGWTKKDMFKAMDEAYSEPYSFLQINMRCPKSERLRKNLDIQLSKD